MNESIVAGKTWVAFGSAGAVGSIHSLEDGYEVRMLGTGETAVYPSLAVAQSALHANLLPGSERPEFREH
jgi:hypothetical protein